MLFNTRTCDLWNQRVKWYLNSKRPFKINSIPYGTCINTFYIHLRIMYTVNTLNTTRIFVVIDTSYWWIYCNVVDKLHCVLSTTVSGHMYSMPLYLAICQIKMMCSSQHFHGMKSITSPRKLEHPKHQWLQQPQPAMVETPLRGRFFCVAFQWGVRALLVIFQRWSAFPDATDLLKLTFWWVVTLNCFQKNSRHRGFCMVALPNATVSDLVPGWRNNE